MSEVVVDWTRCDGHGLCARLLPASVGLDEWGFPIVTPGPLSPEMLKDARLAVQTCPRLALSLRS
jgi:ferredoxin